MGRTFSSFIAFASIIVGSSDFVHLTKDAKGVWWLEHNDKQFMYLGVNHVNNGGQDDGVGGRERAECQAATNNSLCGDTLSFSGVLGFAPYYNVTQAKYGPNETVWAEAAIARLTGANFTMISGWSAHVAEQAAARVGMYYAHLLDIGVTWPHAWSDGLDYDVWSANFSNQAATIAARVVPQYANDEYLLGWQLDNEINWNVVGLNKYLGYGQPAPGYSHALAFLETRYATLSALNTAWNITATSWDDIRNHLSDKGLNKNTFSSDDQDFIGVVAGQYFAVSTAAIKQYDPNHLMLGVRLAVSTPQIIMAANPYVDLWDQHSYDDLPPIPWLSQIYNMTGKPVVVGEFSFTAIDSNMPNTHGARANNPCTTQTQRAAMWRAFTTALAPLPHVVGWAHWQYADEPAAGRWPDGENSNYGLAHLSDDAYTILLDTMASVHSAAPAWHAAGNVIEN